MTVEIVDWAGGGVRQQLREAGYPVREAYETDMEDVLEVAGHIYSLGLNVMLKHQGDGVLIAVDDRGFGQR